jgi:hypothetical protein
MPIYSFEGSQTVNRLAGKLVMVDTSYLIALSDEDDRYHNCIQPFHFSARTNGTAFIHNVVVRQEFLKDVRKKLLIGAMIELAAQDPQIEERYRRVTGYKLKALHRKT